jgi:hypothetical protein
MNIAPMTVNIKYTFYSPTGLKLVCQAIDGADRSLLLVDGTKPLAQLTPASCSNKVYE